MLLRLLEKQHEEAEHSRVYSIGVVAGREAGRVWRIRYKDAEVLIQTRRVLAPGSWVRFCGSVHSGIVVCDFVEALDGIDVELLVKCIRRLFRASPKQEETQ